MTATKTKYKVVDIHIEAVHEAIPMEVPANFNKWSASKKHKYIRDEIMLYFLDLHFEIGEDCDE